MAAIANIRGQLLTKINREPNKTKFKYKILIKHLPGASPGRFGRF